MTSEESDLPPSGAVRNCRMQTWDDSYMKALSAETCSLFRGASNAWKSANSTVRSLPALNVVESPDATLREVGASLVTIAGPSNESLHVHSSHLVGLITRGNGWLCVSNSDGRGVDRVEVWPGDVVVIPRGVLHLFDCDLNDMMEYVALEISDRPLDYQKHWKE